MKVRCDRNELADRLQAVAGIVAATTTPKPILRDYLLRATGERFVVEATDLDLSARVHVDRVEVEEEGVLALPAVRLQSLVREIPTNTVSIQSRGGADQFGAHLASEGYEFTLLGDDPFEFPEVQAFAAEEAVSVPREKFFEMLRRVSVAAARDTGRYQLTGVYFEIDEEKITMTATDGKRLTNDTMRVENPAALVVRAIVPNRAVDALLKILVSGDESIRLAFTESEIQVGFGYGEFMAKLIEGSYPDYTVAMPKEKKTKVVVRRADLLAAVRSASLVTDRDSATIVYRFDGEVASLESRASDIGESKIQIPITLEGEALEIRFNPVYFIDALRTVNEEQIRLEFCGPERPGTIRGGIHYRHMLMPLVKE